ncbi:hypothetical protein DWB68_01350 [Galactobacter valiniphilus]|uniref:Uncharacterized protein n=1 Tax=Galactobacter valiniphilus TaxID=2676122 RepID=A0A399JHC3_9MICC|nr:hypothetical protein [Galactobacter valiniphilus]RII43582.1 hypothetical protein DWB68_01350 [Galactobacter valiniphilus]
MATKRYDPTATDFNGRYARWVAALESGDDAELLEATVALPTLNNRVLKKLAAVDRDEPDSTVRAERKRVIVLLSEINANQAARLRERKQAEQRRRDRTVRVERRVELPTTCARCGAKLKEVKSTGRPRLYCSPACRKAAYEDRRAHRDGAVKVQIVEKLITEVRERRIDVPHPRSECIDAVLYDNDALVQAMWVLIDYVADENYDAFSSAQSRFWDLYNNVEVLYETLVKRAAADERRPPVPEATPTNKHRRNMHLMTRRDPASPPTE